MAQKLIILKGEKSMKKILSALCLLVMLLCLFSFVGCDMLSGIFDNLGDDTTEKILSLNAKRLLDI